MVTSPAGTKATPINKSIVGSVKQCVTQSSSSDSNSNSNSNSQRGPASSPSSSGGGINMVHNFLTFLKQRETISADEYTTLSASLGGKSSEEIKWQFGPIIKSLLGPNRTNKLNDDFKLFFQRYDQQK